MKSTAFHTVSEYYRAMWHAFDVEALREVLGPNVNMTVSDLNKKTFHTYWGRNEVIALYRGDYFATTDPEATEIFDYHVRHDKASNTYYVSYRTHQSTKSDEKRYEKSICDVFTLSPDHKRIIGIIHVQNMTEIPHETLAYPSCDPMHGKKKI